MDFYKIIALALISVIAISVVKQLKPEFAVPLTVGASVVILCLLCDKLYEVVYAFYDFAEQTSIDSDAISCVIKVVGIGYLAEFSNNICIDTNCKSIGDKVMLASKIAIIFCALPIVEKLLDLIKDFVL